MVDEYCEDFLKHTANGNGDDHVFYFRGKLHCDKLDCENQMPVTPVKDLEVNNYFRECMTSGLKRKVEN